MLSVAHLKTLTDRELDKEISRINHLRAQRHDVNGHLRDGIKAVRAEQERRLSGGKRDMRPWMGMDDPRNQEL